MKQRRGVIAASAGLLLLAAGVGLSGRAPVKKAPDAPPATPAPDVQAPDFALKDVLTGKAVKLSSTKGKVVLLEIFAMH